MGDIKFNLSVRNFIALDFIPSVYYKIKNNLEQKPGTEEHMMRFDDIYIPSRIRKALWNGNIIWGLPLKLWSVLVIYAKNTK